MMLHAATAAAIALAPSLALADDAGDWIRQTLRDAAATSWGDRQAAIIGTLSRLEGVSLPTTGRALIVNIPAGVATADEDGRAVIESRVIVGRDDTPTPSMTSIVTYVRPNPTWTVPRASFAGRDGASSSPRIRTISRRAASRSTRTDVC